MGAEAIEKKKKKKKKKNRKVEAKRKKGGDHRKDERVFLNCEHGFVRQGEARGGEELVRIEGDRKGGTVL